MEVGGEKKTYSFYTLGYLLELIIKITWFGISFAEIWWFWAIFFLHEKSFEHMEIIFFRSKFGEKCANKKTLTNTHHHIMQDGWMVCGQETIVHCIPIHLIMVVNYVLTIHMNLLLLTLHLISWNICSVNTLNVIGFFKNLGCLLHCWWNSLDFVQWPN
jgi:hypothetical protein